ncbi:hypothetical protein C900_01233 [Fulvivirga imtechensis AK7]|uniref:DUF4168 domain-containing protein n=1 Tax=Fulvivirga imtechensis AK7 TaxID=1237149 RepID=L8JY35_9BACT|nr:hypothetical protein [Fulvivirga imtechensis]ELR72559.1 hypothetical protein C900_01233 [Fulvivirga imtechensis AK7]
MRKFNYLFVALLLLLAGNAAVAQEEISDEDLRRYALMMEVVDAMKAEISGLTNEMIRNQEGIDGRRYMELAKANGNAAKLEEMGAKDYEKKFMEVITAMQDERKEAISEVVQILATKMLPDGGKTYKAIKSGLNSDQALKARYEKIEAKMKLGDAGDA